MRLESIGFWGEHFVPCFQIKLAGSRQNNLLLFLYFVDELVVPGQKILEISFAQFLLPFPLGLATLHLLLDLLELMVVKQVLKHLFLGPGLEHP